MHSSISSKKKNRISKMFDVLSEAPEEVMPSKYWIELNKENLWQLENVGYETSNKLSL